MKMTIALILVFATATAAYAKPKPRIYINGSGNSDVRGSMSGAVTLNHHDQTMEAAEDFQKVCPGTVTVTVNQASADYTVTINHEAFNGVLHQNDQIMVSNKAGDLLNVHKTRSVKDAIKDACTAISADWSAAGE